MSDNEPHLATCHVSPLSTPCRCCSDHRQIIDQLLAELDAERAAAATAAAESMAMIRRLQREKSEAMLESRQFRRFAEEQEARYRFEIEALDEVLTEREETILSLSNELEDCKKVFDDLPQWVNYTLDDAAIMEKQVIKQSPNSPNQIRHLSSSSSGCRLDFDNYESDDITDGACTIGTVHSSSIPNNEELMYSKSSSVVGIGEEEIRKLSERVKVLEKDRESMKQVMDSTEIKKGKGIILKEIKQKLCEDAVPQKKKVIKQGGFFKRFSILPILKFPFRWIKSTFFNRKKPLRIRMIAASLCQRAMSQRVTDYLGYWIGYWIKLEIKFEPNIMCKPVDKRISFGSRDFGDGDITCYRTSEIEANYRYPDVPSFLEHVHNRQVINIVEP